MNTSKPVQNTQFCLLETTVGLVSVGRVIEFEVCGQKIIQNRPTLDYGYNVDRSTK